MSENDSSLPEDTEETKESKPMGGKRPGAGRPRGARNYRPSRVEIDSHGSTKKLEALGFDPIEAHIKAIEEIDIRLNKEDQKKKPSSMAVSQLLSIKEKHVSSLMRYGYRQVPEKTEIESKVNTFGITLTDSPTLSKPGEETLSSEESEDFNQPQAEDTKDNEKLH
jgi:hypothetical protein